MSWTRARLKDIGTWYGGGTPAKLNRDFWTDGDIPWLSPKDMGPDVLTSTIDRVTAAAVVGSSTKLVPAGSVAVVTRSGILERTVPVAVVPFATTMNQDMKAVVPHSGIDPRWIAWGLRAYERDLLRDTRKAGTTVASIEMPRFLGFELPVPALDEQRRIVAILEDHLSRLDAAVECLATSRRRLQSLEQAALAGCRDGELRRLGEVTAIQGGIQKQQKRAPRANAYPFLRVANVTADGLDLADVHSIELFDGELDRLRLQAGDLLVVEGNGSASQIGRAALWDGSIRDCVHQNHLIRVRPNDGLLPEYLEAVWNSPQSRSNLSDAASSSSGLHTLSVSKLKALSIPVPSVERQRQLVAQAGAVRTSRVELDAVLRDAVRRAGALRRSLLTAAFSGRLSGSARHSNVEETEAI